MCKVGLKLQQNDNTSIFKINLFEYNFAVMLSHSRIYVCNIILPLVIVLDYKTMN